MRLATGAYLTYRRSVPLLLNARSLNLIRTSSFSLHLHIFTKETACETVSHLPYPNSHLTQTFKMTGDSKVGTSGVYEAGDQRNAKNGELQHADRFHEGKDNSHQANDSSTSRPVFRRGHSLAESDFLAEDQRSIANRLAAEEVRVTMAAFGILN